MPLLLPLKHEAMEPCQSIWGCWHLLRRKILSAKSLILFLDYDGTLTPLREHPSQVRLSARTRHLLEELACRPHVWVALVSGRALRDLKRSVGLKDLYYVGNHGLELEGPQLRYMNPKAKSSRPVLRQIARRLKKVMKTIPGAWVEDKGLTLTLHYRLVAPGQAVLVKNSFYGLVRPHQEKGQVRVTTGKEVFEVRPPVRWTKGTIVNWLLARCLAHSNGNGVLSVYIGDDETDEDAFEALGPQGVTVAVGPRTLLTKAQYRVRSPEEVGRMVERILADWSRKDVAP